MGKLYEENPLDIHAALKSARKKSGLSLAQVGEELGITDASVSRMENRQSKVTTDRLIDLAKLYKVSASALLEGGVVTNPNTIDLERLRLIVEEIETVISRMKARPTPSKIGLAVAEIYREEIEYIVANVDAQFDPKRHTRRLELIFKT